MHCMYMYMYLSPYGYMVSVDDSHFSNLSFSRNVSVDLPVKSYEEVVPSQPQNCSVLQALAIGATGNGEAEALYQNMMSFANSRG